MSPAGCVHSSEWLALSLSVAHRFSQKLSAGDKQSVVPASSCLSVQSISVRENDSRHWRVFIRLSCLYRRCARPLYHITSVADNDEQLLSLASRSSWVVMANYRLVAATTDSGDSLPRQMANVHCLDIDTPVHEDQFHLYVTKTNMFHAYGALRRCICPCPHIS